MTYVIAGFGKFGKIALERLITSFDRPRIIVVESQSHALSTKVPDHVLVKCGDVVSFLKESSELRPEDIIVPMVPFHLLAAYAMATHPSCREVPLPEGLEQMVPNPVRLNPSTLCCSRADFMCPDDCPEGELCTVTGEPRVPLYSDMERMKVPGYTVLMQRSFQILPGIGGYPVNRFADLASRVIDGRYLVATSCKCHAILTALVA